MLQRLLNTVRGLNSTQDVQSFYNQVLTDGYPGLPTVEEAKRDYAAMMKVRNVGMIGY